MPVYSKYTIISHKAGKGLSDFVGELKRGLIVPIRLSLDSCHFVRKKPKLKNYSFPCNILLFDDKRRRY